MIVHSSTNTEETGFTLIELLVVMIIIGILAAIAIPVFMNQRKSAVDTSIRSDLRNAATVVESFYVDNNAYPDDFAEVASDVIKDDDTTITLTTDADGTAYCLVATRVAGALPGTGTWTYDSDGGGILGGHGACTQ